ncbi:hypothetical protein [Oceanispirochaeta sp.]|jgi:hypothetical protein|uniref:hypothetical protein n=1 Tax=Oceanispirochaeta sp. TaxID=2035350 RepID=UPI00263124EE|nr:hypothetical protein [Oceanispirochaeta sp.]MDA3957321.1 hypothetical protein [Oceanispirochaeta sp.]
MNVKKLLEEYSLEIDDVRWYLSLTLTERIQSMLEQEEDLTRFIWSAELSDELYNMEEHYLTRLQDQVNEKTLDESHLREILSDMETARRRRLGF